MVNLTGAINNARDSIRTNAETLTLNVGSLVNADGLVSQAGSGALVIDLNGTTGTESMRSGLRFTIFHDPTDGRIP